jgi:hypothetical protein
MSKEDKSALLARREGVLELCHNWGTGSSFLSYPAKAHKQRKTTASRDTLPETMILEKVSDIFA